MEKINTKELIEEEEKQAEVQSNSDECVQQEAEYTEYKNIHLKNVNFDKEDIGTFCGYASVFNNIDSYNDVILPGAFKKTLLEKFANKSIKLLWQHTPKEPIGIIEELKEDSHGLFIKGKLLLEGKRAKEAHQLIKEGAISGLSIGFNVRNANKRDNNKGVRVIKEVELWEVSVVTFPANEESNITAIASNNEVINEKNKQDVEEIKSLKDVEKILKNNGFSQKDSKIIISKIKEFKNQRDVENEETEEDTENQRDVEKKEKNRLLQLQNINFQLFKITTKI